MNKTEPILNVRNADNQFYTEWLDVVDEKLYRCIGKVSTAFAERYDFNGMFISDCPADTSAEHVIERELTGHD